MFARGAKVMGGQPAGPYAARLRAASIQVLDVALLRWSELMAFATATGFPWPFGSKTACLALFSQTWAEGRMSKLNEMDGAPIVES